MALSNRTWLAWALVAVGAAVLAALALRPRTHHAPEIASPPPPLPLPPPSLPVVSAPSVPVDAGAVARTIVCRSADGKYEVDLRFESPNSTVPSRAHVVIDGGAPEAAQADWFPPPGELTCSPELEDSDSSHCHVAGTADYGYLANVSTKQGRGRVELRKNGVASTRLAMLNCRE